MFSQKFELELDLDIESTKIELYKIVHIIDDIVWHWGFFESIQTPYKGFFYDDRFTIIIHEIFTCSMRPILYGEIIEENQKTKIIVDMEIYDRTILLFKFMIAFLIVINIVVSIAFKGVLLDVVIGLAFVNALFLLFCLPLYYSLLREQKKAESVLKESLSEFLV